MKQGVDIGRSLPDPPDLHGRLFCQLFQPLWPAVAGLCRGRGQLSHQRRRTWACSTCATSPGQRVPLSALTSCQAPHPARNSPCTTTNIAARKSTAAPPRATARTRPTKALEEVFAQTMPAGDGLRLLRACPSRKSRRQKASRRAAIFGLSLVVRVSDPGRALRKLVAAVQRAAGHAHRGLRGLRRP